MTKKGPLPLDPGRDAVGDWSRRRLLKSAGVLGAAGLLLPTFLLSREAEAGPCAAPPERPPCA